MFTIGLGRLVFFVLKLVHESLQRALALGILRSAFALPAAAIAQEEHEEEAGEEGAGNDHGQPEKLASVEGAFAGGSVGLAGAYLPLKFHGLAFGHAELPADPGGGVLFHVVITIAG